MGQLSTAIVSQKITEARRIAANITKLPELVRINDLLLQLIIVVAAGAFCFGCVGCGYLTAFIVTRYNGAAK